jgi:hypothetical protein
MSSRPGSFRPAVDSRERPLMFALESEFGIQFSDAELTTFPKVGVMRRSLVQASE